MNKQGTGKIEWCNWSWSPIVGCLGPDGTPCPYCYAHVFSRRRMGEYGKQPHGEEFKPRFLAERLEEPLRLRKPNRIFTGSMTDFFGVGVLGEWLVESFAVMAACNWQTFIILTKQPKRMYEVLSDDVFVDAVEKTMRYHTHSDLVWPLPNLWPGVSVTCQKDCDERVPWLLRTPAAVRLLSVEPLLGPIGNLVRTVEPDEWAWDEVRALEDSEDIQQPEEFIEECEAENDWINCGQDLVYNPEHREWLQWRHEAAQWNTFNREIGWLIIGAQTGRGAISLKREWVEEIIQQFPDIPRFEKRSLAGLLGRELVQQYPK